MINWQNKLNNSNILVCGDVFNVKSKMYFSDMVSPRKRPEQPLKSPPTEELVPRDGKRLTTCTVLITI